MKKKNLYYYAVYKRTNTIKVFILMLFLSVSSWPRIFIETFTRKSFGSRYFLLPLNLFLAVVLAAFPFTGSSYGMSILSVIGANITWYIYLTAFIIWTYKRWQEVKREPGVYDFARFSLSPGIIHPWFRTLRIPGIDLTSRIIAIYIESGIAILAGVILLLLEQRIGMLLVISGIIYGFSWAAQYYIGDQFIMDKIDEMIANEEMTETFVHGRMPEETRGFEADSSKIHNREFKRKVADSMVEEDPAVDVL